MAQIVQYLFLLIAFQTVSDVFCNISAFKYPKSSHWRIVGGHPIAIQEVPYQVAIFADTNQGIIFGCGGSILNERTILTSAYCVRSGPWTFYIRVGSADKDSGGQKYLVSKIHRHPKYVESDYDYNVAVLKLDTDMKLDNVTTKAVTLAKSGVDTPTGTKLLIAGWGRTSSNGPHATTLLGTKVSVVDQDVCKKAYLESKYDITPRMICAADKGKDACQGDSGGAAVSLVTGEQVGFASWGIECALEGFPGVYTRVSDPEVSEFINKLL